MSQIEKALRDAWVSFCDANPDDLTSPEDLPDHALMTYEQFVEYALSAVSPMVPTEEPTMETLGLFGHHPDPANDFCIEVEAIEGLHFNALHGISKPGTTPPTMAEVQDRISRAMEFRVGGDEIAVKAKAKLRALTPIAPAEVEDGRIDWPWVLRSRADAAYLKDTEGTVKLLRTVADYIETSKSAGAAAPAEVAVADWRVDPALDDRWNAGVDFVMEQLCKVLNVDPRIITWDAATETLDGDVQSVLCNILRKHFGDEWGPTPAQGATEPLSVLELLPTHIILLKRGTASRWIGLSDHASTRITELAALRDLGRAGFARPTEDELPSDGPPTPTPWEITDAGRAALTAALKVQS
ncbi:hypothetical protein [Phyllobacterium chamaecytisi]|uniref:hypothetical protein n=1 Tax=Phyllobacterium chamaecytisi TaxID=2876082 RepID=UPI001CC8FA2B|nr:hypothetical protein [Phyllobacterium sp. KW56]MBZ9600686.1 hypothetical protein [Phyllobacterium sp. KW56]